MKRSLTLLLLSQLLASYAISQTFPLVVVDETTRKPLYVLSTPVDTFGCDSIDHMRGVFHDAVMGVACSVESDSMKKQNSAYSQKIEQQQMIIDRDEKIIIPSKDSII